MTAPKITVVTPVYNQVNYIEDTIQSVISQRVEGLEYIVLDGGSTDGTAEVIRKYERHLTHWESGRDGGHVPALIKGLGMAKGDILCWLNGDDYFEPHTVKAALATFAAHPEAQLIYGDYSVLTEDGRKVPKPKISFDFPACLFAYLMIPQPSSFWRRSFYFEVGGLNNDFPFSFDYDFFLRAGAAARSKPGGIRHVQDLWSVFRLHSESKSVAQKEKFVVENETIRAQFPEYRNCKLKKIAAKYQLARVLWRFHRERGLVPTRKDSSKA